jgi:pimeloyl-ACP methyl ester carboxylesterase
MTASLYVRQLGEGSPTLLLLHGLGVNGDVWEGFLERLSGWPGRIVVPDLRGHGRSPHAPRYSDVDHAADVAALVSSHDDIHIIGHSMGGVIGLTLAALAHNVKNVFAFAVKAEWNDAELIKLKQYAETPARRFDTKAEAVERFLRASGLKDLVGTDAPVVEAGITKDEAGYRLAADPRTVMVAGTSLRPIFRESKADSRLACGSRDPLVTLAQLRAIDASALDLGPHGHNIHVEKPDQLFRAVAFLNG